MELRVPQSAMRPCKIVTIVGARPQFIKAAMVSKALSAFNKQHNGTLLEESVVHTGQHYDENMSRVFFDQLNIPRPSVNLEVGSGSHGYQTGRMLERVETILLNSKADWAVVYGDTNSTLAGALAAAKLHIPVVHVEAGLRSFNRLMPEETNRIVSDHLSTLLFSPTDTSTQNLAREGITKGVYQVGDVMYDSVLFNAGLAEQTSKIMQHLNVTEKSFYLTTIHRAENTDDPERLHSILSILDRLDTPVVLPAHPRIRKTLETDLPKISNHFYLIDPVSYLDMLVLEKNARIILTDSGGVQKEAYWFGVPCVTLRSETEWIELVQAGCNHLVGPDMSRIPAIVAKAEEKVGMELPTDASELYGDGHSSEKIVNILYEQAAGIQRAK